MNTLFFIIFTLSAIIVLFINPNYVLAALQTGGEKALKLTLSMIVIYAFSLALVNVLDKCGINQKLSKLLAPLNKTLLKSKSEKANEYISLNLSANILGMGSIATPMGIKACNELSKDKKNTFALCMFFVINGTGLQLLPVTLLSLRQSSNSVSPESIILPCLLTSLIATFIGVLLVKIFIKNEN